MRDVANSAEVCRPAVFAEHLAGLGIEGGLQCRGDMAKVRTEGHDYRSRRRCGRGQEGATFSHVGCGQGGAVCFLGRADDQRVAASEFAKVVAQAQEKTLTR